MLKRICLLESIIDPYINRGLDYRGGPLGFEPCPKWRCHPQNPLFMFLREIIGGLFGAIFFCFSGILVRTMKVAYRIVGRISCFHRLDARIVCIFY